MFLYPAAAFAITYSPGQTLDPACFPTDPSCIVAAAPTNVAGAFQATSTTATSTFTGNISVSGTATTTRFYGAGLVMCTSGNVLTWTNGQFGCTVDQSGGGGGAWPFTPSTNYGVAVQSTSTPIWASNGLMASSTSYFVNASTTALTVSDRFYGAGLIPCTSGNFLTWTGGSFGCAADQTGSNAWPFTPAFYNGVANQSTTTPLWLKDTMILASTTFFTTASTTLFTNSGMSWLDGGLLAYASSTIGSGTQSGGLTINGGATTTGNAYFAGNMGIGTTSPWGLLSVNVDGISGPSFVVGSSTATNFIVTNGGKAGIGTASPSSLLHIYGTSAILTIEANGSSQTPGLAIQNSTGVTSAGLNYFTATGESRLGGLSASAFTTFYSGNVEALRITTPRNIGIGTTSPWAKLSIAGAANAATPLFTISTSTTGATSTAFIIDQNGNVGIGTSTPTTALQVNGAVTPNVTNAFTLGNATYLWSAVYATNNVIQTSDARLKDNIASTTYGLDQVLQLRPVSYTWKAHPEQGTYLGFIAQEVQPILPETVSVGNDANHTLGLTYTEFIPVIVHAIQQLASKISDLATTVASFADHFTTRELTFTRATGDDLTVKHLHADEACLPKSDGSEVCISGDQLAAVLALAGQSPAPTSSQSSSAASAPATPPVLVIAGENPAHIHVGDTYNDLGAIITAPEQDKNFSIKTYLNGTLVSDIVLDTSAPATSTIDYVVTGTNGLTSTSTRTVIVDASAPPAPQSLPITNSPPIVPTTDSATSTATSTSQ